MRRDPTAKRPRLRNIETKRHRAGLGRHAARPTAVNEHEPGYARMPDYFLAAFCLAQRAR
jgi:hypothetical protein